MKTKFITLLAAIGLLLTGCTSETDTYEAQNKGTKILLSLGGNGNAQTRMTTTFDGSGLKSVWDAGDEIAAIDENTGQLVKLSFAGFAGNDQSQAYFESAQALTVGHDYRLMYPYNVVSTYTSKSNKYSIGDETHVGNDLTLKNEILQSESKTIPATGKIPSFTLNHLYTMIHVHLTMNNTTDKDMFMRRMWISSGGYDGSKLAWKSLYFDPSNNYNIEYVDNSLMMESILNGADQCRVASNSSKEFDFWLPFIKQDLTGMFPLMVASFKDVYSSDLTELYGGGIQPNLSDMQPGTYYTINLTAEVVKIEGQNAYMANMTQK